MLVMLDKQLQFEEKIDNLALELAQIQEEKYSVIDSLDRSTKLA